MARRGEVSKSRRGRTPAEEKRPERWRFYGYLFLIVCEDEATEPEYFKTFLAEIPKKTLYLRTVGTGRDPLGVVEQAQAKRNELEAEASREVDEVWLVFDKDDADREPGKTARFLEAEKLAATEPRFHLAFSNEVFELWLLLHLTEVGPEAELHREEIYHLLGETLRQHPEFAVFQYSHRETPADVVIGAVLSIGNEAEAIARATAMLAAHGDKPLLQTNPSTRMHLLVQSLRAWIRYFREGV